MPVFLKAMVDPAKTPNALTALIKTSFMHYIDHSSLALVSPRLLVVRPELTFIRSFLSSSVVFANVEPTLRRRQPRLWAT